MELIQVQPYRPITLSLIQPTPLQGLWPMAMQPTQLQGLWPMVMAAYPAVGPMAYGHGSLPSCRAYGLWPMAYTYLVTVSRATRYMYF